MSNTAPRGTDPAVNFTASYQRGDGSGWNHISITLRPGATHDEIAQAIDTWRAIEAQALPALIENSGSRSASAGASYQRPPEPPATEPQHRRIKNEAADLKWTPQQLEAYAQAHGADSVETIGKHTASRLIDNLIKLNKNEPPTIAPPAIEAPAAAIPPAAATPPSMEQPARPAKADDSDDLPF